MEKVKDIMTKGVISCGLYTPIQEVAKIMSDKGISAVVIVDEEGVLRGIISQTDLVNIRAHENFWEYWQGLSAKHIMTKDVITIREDEKIEEACRLMKKYGVHRLVVTKKISDRDYPIGILSMTDVVKHMANIGEGT